MAAAMLLALAVAGGWPGAIAEEKAADEKTAESKAPESKAPESKVAERKAADEKAGHDAPAGCAIGAEVPSFYVREVTGSRPNQAICLVCRYGGRPAVLVCARGLDEHVQDLLVKLDRVVDGQRAQGLRGFAIFLDAKAAELQPKLFNLAHREKMSLPLAFPVETGGPRSLDLPEKAQVTVLLYRQKKIERRFVFAPGGLSDKEIQRVVEAAKQFAEPAATQAADFGLQPKTQTARVQAGNP